MIDMLKHVEVYNQYTRCEPKDNVTHLTPYVFKKETPGSTPTAVNII